MEQPRRLVLASTSVYRKALLQRLGLRFEVEPPGVDEKALPAEAPPETALRLSALKARALEKAFPDALILGSDQVASCGGERLGKPGDHATATRQLRRLSGNTADFHTAIALLDAKQGELQSRVVLCRVSFRRLDDSLIETYLRREQPYDCAGSAKSEGLGIALIARIETEDPTSLVGLPLIALTGMLGRAGLPRALILYAIPCALGGAPADALPESSIRIVRTLRDFAVENAKSARSFLGGLGMSVRELNISEIHEDSKSLLQPLREGRPMGLLSEAGCPAIADPGATLIEFAHREGFRVVPLVGPSSITLALMASGLEGQRFAFCGYLPRDKAQREARIRELEKRSRKEDETEIFIETPYRNDEMMKSLLGVCSLETRLCVAADLTLPTETIVSKSVKQWRSAGAAIGRRPAVFLLLADPR